MIISLISFATKDNVNIEEQYFEDDEDFYYINKEYTLPSERKTLLLLIAYPVSSRIEKTKRSFMVEDIESK